MKKTFLLSIALLAPFMSFAVNSDQYNDLACVQVIQAAINTNGECKEFSTPCDVPNDWKKVDSCSNFTQKKEYSSSIDSNTKRRYQARWKKLTKIYNKVKEKKAEKGNNHSFLRGAGEYLKNHRKNIAQEAKSTSNRRSYAKKNWYSKFKKFISSPARQEAIEKKKAAQDLHRKAVKRNVIRKSSASATKAVRQGKLSNEFFSLQKKQRNERFKSVDSSKLKKALKKRQPFLRRKAKKTKNNSEKRAKIRRTYRKSTRGSLN